MTHRQSRATPPVAGDAATALQLLRLNAYDAAVLEHSRSNRGYAA